MQVHQAGSHLMKGGRPQVDDWSWARTKQRLTTLYRLARPYRGRTALAVASLLETTGRWARGDGPEPYPLAEACQDHLLGLAIGESARTGADVRVTRQPWA